MFRVPVLNEISLPRLQVTIASSTKRVSEAGTSRDSQPQLCALTEAVNRNTRVLGDMIAAVNLLLSHMINGGAADVSDTFKMIREKLTAHCAGATSVLPGAREVRRPQNGNKLHLPTRVGRWDAKWIVWCWCTGCQASSSLFSTPQRRRTQ